jgi:hypothetical protein
MMRRAPCLLLAFLATSAASAADPEPRQKTWFEQVERDRDRGAGRVVDRPTWEAQRFEERRDVRLGRAEPRRAFDRFEEDRDRQLQIESMARRQQGQPSRGIGAAGSVVLNQQGTKGTTGGGAGLPTLAAVVAKDQRDLAEAKETLDRSLRAVDAAEARELRLLRRRLTRERKAERYDVERAPIAERFDRLRAEHRQVYDTIRRRILGGARPTESP